ncbi:hypothetical protein D9V32_06690 [Mycetocola tolaasinivorans]|uniref:DNA polymerase III subunit gamma/tau n=1 Tax=Mycetocola tolaasinivorans TaxID=76635 RepID=A0A3L7AB13_9MICO|nr:hypothetical protein [Mycetocola tolaasinivorans]RLP76532.1 hypothetical protein D9V32_06690 [Mycetocola tolaasinivorans]
MSTPSDDDALSWAGDATDATLVGQTPVAAPKKKAAPAAEVPAAGTEVAPGWRVVGGPKAEAVAVSTGSTQMSSVLLLVHGILAGVYLLYMIGWLFSMGTLLFDGADPLTTSMTSIGKIFAVLAPALWFGTTLWNTRHSGSLRWRIIALIAGAIVLAPIPFLLGVR